MRSRVCTPSSSRRTSRMSRSSAFAKHSRTTRSRELTFDPAAGLAGGPFGFEDYQDPSADRHRHESRLLAEPLHVCHDVSLRSVRVGTHHPTRVAGGRVPANGPGRDNPLRVMHAWSRTR